MTKQPKELLCKSNAIHRIVSYLRGLCMNRDKHLEEIEDDVLEELQEMYESMVPAFVEAYPSVFDPVLYSLEAFVWADYVISNYSLSGNLFAIVPL